MHENVCETFDIIDSHAATFAIYGRQRWRSGWVWILILTLSFYGLCVLKFVRRKAGFIDISFAVDFNSEMWDVGFIPMMGKLRFDPHAARRHVFCGSFLW